MWKSRVFLLVLIIGIGNAKKFRVHLEDDSGESGVRVPRSIGNFARLLLGGSYVSVQLGNVPPDHPLVQYPDPIYSPSSISSKVIASVPGMTGIIGNPNDPQQQQYLQPQQPTPFNQMQMSGDAPIPAVAFGTNSHPFSNQPQYSVPSQWQQQQQQQQQQQFNQGSGSGAPFYQGQQTGPSNVNNQVNPVNPSNNAFGFYQNPPQAPGNAYNPNQFNSGGPSGGGAGIQSNPTNGNAYGPPGGGNRFYQPSASIQYAAQQPVPPTFPQQPYQQNLQQNYQAPQQGQASQGQAGSPYNQQQTNQYPPTGSNYNNYPRGNSYPSMITSGSNNFQSQSQSPVQNYGAPAPPSDNSNQNFNRNTNNNQENVGNTPPPSSNQNPGNSAQNPNQNGGYSQQQQSQNQNSGYPQQNSNQNSGYPQQNSNQNSGYPQQNSNQNSGYSQQNSSQNSGYTQSNSNQQNSGHQQQNSNQNSGYQQQQNSNQNSGYQQQQNSNQNSGYQQQQNSNQQNSGYQQPNSNQNFGNSHQNAAPVNPGQNSNQGSPPTTNSPPNSFNTNNIFIPQQQPTNSQQNAWNANASPSPPSETPTSSSYLSVPPTSSNQPGSSFGGYRTTTPRPNNYVQSNFPSLALGNDGRSGYSNSNSGSPKPEYGPPNSVYHAPISEYGPPTTTKVTTYYGKQSTYRKGDDDSYSTIKSSVPAWPTYGNGYSTVKVEDDDDDDGSYRPPIPVYKSRRTSSSYRKLPSRYVESFESPYRRSSPTVSTLDLVETIRHKPTPSVSRREPKKPSRPQNLDIGRSSNPHFGSSGERGTGGRESRDSNHRYNNEYLRTFKPLKIGRKSPSESYRHPGIDTEGLPLRDSKVVPSIAVFHTSYI